jgi:NAD(P)-dependent dehydrogenase (short-subunit alcohol dehydrogenase family)
VNALAPGNVTTPMVEDWFRSEGGRREMNRWPRRRMMRSEDLDGALLFLCGPQAASVTGTILTVDDGQSL